MKHQQDEYNEEIVKEKAEQSNQKTLMIVFGLPGSGKTTFAKRLKQYVVPSSILIHGDQIQAQFYHSKVQPEALLESQSQLQAFYQSLNYQQNERVPFDPDTWKASRKFIEKTAQKLIKTKSIIIEDDLLYRSQRKPYRKISWIHQCKYIEIFMDTPIQVCLEHINIRKKQSQFDITAETLAKAHQKLQTNQQDSKFTLKLKISQRNIIQTHPQQIKQKMRMIEIKPNDPNDPQFEHLFKKEQKQQNFQEILQIKTKAFVGRIIKNGLNSLENSNLIQEEVLHKLSSNKKEIAKAMASWKKQFVKAKERSLNQRDMEDNLIKWITNR